MFSLTATTRSLSGDTVLWKSSSKTPLTAIACTRIAQRVLEREGYDPAVCSLVVGKGSEIGDLISTDPRVALVSYTGSVPDGRHVGTLVQARFGRLILELGGNNAIIVSNKADIDPALHATYFGAVGTAGQRCTSTRRAIVHASVYDTFIERLAALYAETTIGDPLDDANVMGPLVDTAAVEDMMRAIDAARSQGARVLFGGEKETGGGRESGSDAWKAYMRRQTNTLNFSGGIELAQGIRL